MCDVSKSESSHSGINYAILTVSDRCSAGLAEDLSGIELRKFVERQGGSVRNYAIIPDNLDEIEDKLRSLVSENFIHVILTTGGTGFAPRDVTPEATLRVIEKRAQALETAITVASLVKTPFAVLSRAVCGICQEKLIINLPGSRKGAIECFEAVASTIPHAVALIRNDMAKVKVSHGEVAKHASSAQLNGLKSKVTCDIIGRQRQSKWPMVGDYEASNIIRKVVKDGIKLSEERISVKAAHGRVLAKDVLSAINIPAFDVSVKDGYAVRSVDSADNRTVINHSEPASDAGEFRILGENECIRVTTGAPLPPGADSVVQVEDTELTAKDADKNEEKEIKLKIKAHKGLDVRKRGSDVKIGDLIASHRQYLNSVDLGRIVSVGMTEILVYKKPVVAVLSTGNEIVDAFSGHKVKTGAVYDSNRVTLVSILKKGGFEVIDVGIVPDEPTHLFEKLSFALDKADVVISSGGVSMGEKDFLKPVLETDLGATIHFGRVNMKPGKPTTFASVKRNDKTKLVFALPGNPSSSVATSILFVLPTLRLMEGAIHFNNRSVNVRAQSKSEPYKLDPRPEYYRARLHYDDNAVAKVIINDCQPSSDLSHFAAASVLARLPSPTEVGTQFITSTSEVSVPVIFINDYL